MSIRDPGHTPNSMPVAFLAIIAELLYLAAAGVQLVRLVRGLGGLSRSVLGMGLVALACHAIVVWDTLITSAGVSFGIYRSLALVTFAINVACMTALLWRPLQNLLVGVFPLAAVAVVLSTFGPSTATPRGQLEFGILLHVGASIVAYSILTLAACQSALLALQDSQLRRRHTRGLVQVLPPLQLMESMLFELLWVGVIALSLSILTGFVFMNDMFAQHLVHKSVLSIVAWILFSTLLAGRFWLGWRSQTAVRLTIAGFTVLAVAFFGSKLVLELILHRA